MNSQPPVTITASEIADWVYCPESWRLDALRLPSSNQPARDSGTRHHAYKAIAERIAEFIITLGRVLIVLALAALLLAYLWR